MKKELLQTAKIVLVGLLLSVGVSYVSSSTFWNNAVGVAPSNNADEVINTSDNSQTKEGSLFIEDEGLGKVGADNLFVNTISYFGSKVDIGKKFIGGGGFGLPVSTPDTNLNITGKLSVNLDGGAAFTPTEDVNVAGTIRMRPLAEDENPGISYNATICADSTGTLMLCDAPFGFTWNTTYIPQVGNGECYSTKKTIIVVPTAGTEPYIASWSVSAPGAENDPDMTGSGLARNLTFWKNESTTYTATITVTLDDSSPTVDPITSTYTESVPVQPESLGGGSVCPE